MMIAFCGLDCEGCLIYKATREQDPAEQASLRSDISRICTEQYGMHLRPSDITNCDGCRSPSGILFSGCGGCDIRRCAMRRQHPTCASCDEYPCTKLEQQFAADPSARRHLDDLRGAV